MMYYGLPAGSKRAPSPSHAHPAPHPPFSWSADAQVPTLTFNIQHPNMARPTRSPKRCTVHHAPRGGGGLRDVGNLLGLLKAS
eukprot:357794-Chlamydomonas_euryale.AAC.11